VCLIKRQLLDIPMDKRAASFAHISVVENGVGWYGKNRFWSVGVAGPNAVDVAQGRTWSIVTHLQHKVAAGMFLCHICREKSEVDLSNVSG
jgi:hypothetical protein